MINESDRSENALYTARHIYAVNRILTATYMLLKDLIFFSLPRHHLDQCTWFRSFSVANSLRDRGLLVLTCIHTQRTSRDHQMLTDTRDFPISPFCQGAVFMPLVSHQLLPLTSLSRNVCWTASAIKVTLCPGTNSRKKDEKKWQSAWKPKPCWEKEELVMHKHQ